MTEKHKKNFCLKTRIFNIFISLLFAVSLLILAANVSRADTSKHLYRFAVCGNQIFTGKVDITQARDSGSICNGTENVEAKDSVIGAIRSSTATETTLTEQDIHLENEIRSTKSTGIVTTTDLTAPEDQEEREFFRVEFDMAAPPAEVYPEQLAEERNVSETEHDVTDPVEKENELRQFEKYVNDSFERENLAQSNKELGSIETGKKVKHFAFLKVHKAGSTTMQNIFFRFGLRNNLTFVLPIKGHYLFKAKNVIPVQPGEHFDVLSNHIKNFKGHFFKKFLPKDSVNIAIVREPLDRMISAAFYYREVWNKKYLMDIPEERFIQNLIRKTDKYEPVNLSRTKNSMGLDFGFPKTITANNKKEIETRMGRLVKKFSLVLVMERFDESLILLKRFMNWDISDVMYLPTNSHKHTKANLARRDFLKFRTINFLDYIIYDTFTQILDAKVKAEGEDFQAEVEYFKTVLQFAKTFCEKEDKTADDLKIPASKWNKAFAFSYTECDYINMEELDFVAKLKTRHLKMHNLSNNIIK